MHLITPLNRLMRS